MNYQERLGKILRLYRIRLRWSLTHASWQFGISSALLYKLEHGKTKNPTLKTLARIADVLGISLDHLVGREIPQLKPEKAEALPPYFLTHDFNKLK